MSDFNKSELTRLLTIPAGAGVPETSATRPPSDFDETVPEFSAEYTEAEYLLAGVASSWDCLTAQGITPPSWHEAWRAIGLGMVHGFFLWGITTKVQPDVIATLLHRIGTAVADHDALSVLHE